MSGSFFQPQLSSRWRKVFGLPAQDRVQPVVVPVSPRIALHQFTTLRQEFSTELQAIATSGLQGIGLSRTKLSRYADETVLALLQEFGVKAASLSWAGGFMGSLGFSYEEAFDDAREAVRQAGLWGVENLVVLMGSRNGHTIGHCRKTITDALLYLADEAGDVGVRLALLPLHPQFPSQTSFLNGLDDVLTVLDDLNHPHAGLAFDASEVSRSPKMLKRIPALAARTFLVQVRDGAAEDQSSQGQECLPGQGTWPVAECVQRFLMSGYRGLFDVQVCSPSVWQLPLSDVLQACQQFSETVSGTPTSFS